MSIEQSLKTLGIEIESLAPFLEKKAEQKDMANQVVDIDHKIRLLEQRRQILLENLETTDTEAMTCLNSILSFPVVSPRSKLQSEIHDEKIEINGSYDLIFGSSDFRVQNDSIPRVELLKMVLLGNN
jgi:hypothetical protein